MRPIFAAVAISCCSIATSVHAESVQRFRITAHVDTFCRIEAPGSSNIAIVDGAASIGSVHEICNTPNGYDVGAHFINLRAGILDVEGTAYPILNGIASRSSPHAAVRDSIWRLREAEPHDPARPVSLQVTITPRS